MKCPIKENFDIEKAQAGIGTVETKGGMPVKIISYNANDGNCPIIALLEYEGKENDVVVRYDIHGCSYDASGCKTAIPELELCILIPNDAHWSDVAKETDGYRVALNSSGEAYIEQVNGISYNTQTDKNCNVFACSKQAKSALAMARISQIMANDEYYGFPITDEEWRNNAVRKYCIARCIDYCDDDISTTGYYHFLAFHTREQRDAFMADYPQLVFDYLMLE